MKRREFIGLLGGAAASRPFAGRAQQPDRVPVTGILWHAGSESEEAIFLGAFRRGLSDLGYVRGRQYRARRHLRGRKIRALYPKCRRTLSHERSMYWWR